VEPPIMNFHFSLYRLHRKGRMATKFTVPSAISQTSLKALDHSGAIKVHCSRWWLAADND